MRWVILRLYYQGGFVSPARQYILIYLFVMQGVVFQLFVIQREQEVTQQELAPGNTNWQSFATLVRGNTSIMILGI